MRCQQPEQAGLLPFGDFMTDGLFIRGAGSNTKESALCVCVRVFRFLHTCRRMRCGAREAGRVFECPSLRAERCFV